MDRNLNDDMVKLVRYSIVSIQRDREEILVRNQEKIFDDNMDGDAFATWVVSDYADSAGMSSEDRKYLRVSYEVLDRWPQQDRKYEQRQLDVLAEIRDAIEKKDAFATVGRRLDRNSDRLKSLRRGFRRHSDSLAADVAGTLNRFRAGGAFKAIEVKADPLAAAFAEGVDAPFDAAGLESFTGRWEGVNHRYSFATGEEMEADAAVWHMTWGKGNVRPDEYVQTVVGSQVRHYDADALPPISENTVDLALNVYRRDLGITGWLTTRVEFRQELALIAYELRKGTFLWIGQVLDPKLQPVMGENVFWMFLEWIRSRPRAYYMYGLMFAIDFDRGHAEAFGDSFRKARFDAAK